MSNADSNSTDEAINKFLTQKGFEGLTVSGAGKSEGRVDSIQLMLKRTIDEKTLDRALQSKDEATTILLLTLEIEHQLSGFLEDLVGSSNANANNFNTLVLMLRVCRFENDIYTIVDGFRKLRNKFAHEKDASLEKHSSIVKSILSCKIPSPTEDELHSISDGTESIKIISLPILSQLFVYAHATSIFLASANQIYSFSKPIKRILVRTSR